MFENKIPKSWEINYFKTSFQRLIQQIFDHIETIINHNPITAVYY